MYKGKTARKNEGKEERLQEGKTGRNHKGKTERRHEGKKEKEPRQGRKYISSVIHLILKENVSLLKHPY